MCAGVYMNVTYVLVFVCVFVDVLCSDIRAAVSPPPLLSS